MDVFKFFSLWSVIAGLAGAAGVIALLWPMEPPMVVTFGAAGFIVAAALVEILLRLFRRKPAS